ncbi:MAG: hypothetical protein K2L82_14160 [Lachnospiraceae bacterium]|nr:hypothetical protein [Lachnospiraceae bacterium]
MSDKRYDSLIGKIKRYKRRIKVLERQKYASSKYIKRLLRDNAKIRRNVADLVYEVCPHCNTEVAIRWDVKVDGFTAYCPICGKKLYLCSMCDKGIENDGVCGFGYADDSCLQEVGSYGR